MIGIVTVNWKGFEITRKLINQILENDDPNFKLTVVNNSLDEAQEFDQAGFNDARIIIIHSDKNIGYSGGLNLGIQKLLEFPEINHFLLLNNDVEIEKDFLLKLRSEGKSKDTIYAPVILQKESDLVQNTGGTLHLWLGGGINLNKNVPLNKIQRKQPNYLSGCILYMSRHIIETVGLFDEDFSSYCEDVDYCFRSKAQNIRLEILWEVMARHFHSHATKSNNAYKIYLLNRNQILLARKHLRPLKRELFILAAVIRGCFQSLFHGQLRAFFRGVMEGLTI